MQGTARRGSGLCAQRVDQGLAAAAMGCDGGGGFGSGLLWERRHRRVRARGILTRGRAQVTKLGARCRVGQGNGRGRALSVKSLTTGEAQAWMQGTGGLKGVCSECMEMYGPPPLFL